jgi:hypothetical protein
MGHLLGYARVSSADQQSHLQVDALQWAGCYRMFTETASGTRSDRPALEQLLDQLRPGPTGRVEARPTGPVAPASSRRRRSRVSGRRPPGGPSMDIGGLAVATAVATWSGTAAGRGSGTAATAGHGPPQSGKGGRRTAMATVAARAGAVAVLPQSRPDTPGAAIRAAVWFRTARRTAASGGLSDAATGTGRRVGGRWWGAASAGGLERAGRSGGRGAGRGRRSSPAG